MSAMRGGHLSRPARDLWVRIRDGWYEPPPGATPPDEEVAGWIDRLAATGDAAALAPLLPVALGGTWFEEMGDPARNGGVSVRAARTVHGGPVRAAACRAVEALVAVARPSILPAVDHEIRERSHLWECVRVWPMEETPEGFIAGMARLGGSALLAAASALPRADLRDTAAAALARHAADPAVLPFLLVRAADPEPGVRAAAAAAMAPVPAAGREGLLARNLPLVDRLDRKEHGEFAGAVAGVLAGPAGAAALREALRSTDGPVRAAAFRRLVQREGEGFLREARAHRSPAIRRWADRPRPGEGGRPVA
jgi:hypothetical protein